MKRKREKWSATVHVRQAQQVHEFEGTRCEALARAGVLLGHLRASSVQLFLVRGKIHRLVRTLHGHEHMVADGTLASITTPSKKAAKKAAKPRAKKAAKKRAKKAAKPRAKKRAKKRDTRPAPPF